jgi:Uma2 family endonuclease
MSQAAKQLGNMTIDQFDKIVENDPNGSDYELIDGELVNTYVTDPVVVVEVLSPSTMDKDRTTKLAFYKELPTVQHVVLAYTDQMRVEHYIRVDNKWELKVLPTPESVLELSAVEFQMDLEAVYSDVPFDKTPRPRPRPGGFGRGGL